MIAPGVRLEDITEQHLLELVERRAREGRDLEFKSELPAKGEGDEDQKILYAATSFANAGGGDLVFGVAEDPNDRGAAACLRALTVRPDETQLRLENLLRDGVEPRLTGVQMRFVPVEGGAVLIVRIPGSLTAPHAVASRNAGAYRFYTRNSAGKYPLDVHELRLAFTASDEIARRVRDWRLERLGRIRSRETPVPLAVVHAVSLVLHVVSLARATDVDPLRVLPSGLMSASSAVLGVNPDTVRANIDGLLAYDAASALNPGSFGYAQLFRDGRYEAVIAWRLTIQNDSPPYISGGDAEAMIVSGTAQALRVLEVAGAQPPYAVLASLLGAADVKLRPPCGFCEHVIDRDVVLLPDVLYEEARWDAGARLRPVLDALWQASGLERSYGFNDQGWSPEAWRQLL